MPFIPPLAQRELLSARAYQEEHRECLYCAILKGELAAQKRIVLESENFVGFVPFHARWPGEMQIYPRRHIASLADFDEAGATELARMIKAVRMKYDNLWNFAIPLMMMVRQPPTRGDYAYFHFHVEFCPIQRSPTKIKYLAGVESGVGTFLNDTLAEEKAAEYRATEPLKRVTRKEATARNTLIGAQGWAIGLLQLSRNPGWLTSGDIEPFLFLRLLRAYCRWARRLAVLRAEL